VTNKAMAEGAHVCATCSYGETADRRSTCRHRQPSLVRLLPLRSRQQKTTRTWFLGISSITFDVAYTCCGRAAVPGYAGLVEVYKVIRRSAPRVPIPLTVTGVPDMLPSLSLQRHHYRRVGFFAVFIIIFHHRLSVFITLLYTFIAFTFWPHAVLGTGDGWDLENLVPPEGAQEIVPRIVHQVRLGDLEMKEKWIVANASCAELHPGPQWQFELWDTERANAFVAENYPDVLETYLGYGQGALASPSPIRPERNR